MLLVIQAIFEILWMGRYFIIPIAGILILSCVIGILSGRHSTGQSSNIPTENVIISVGSYNEDYVNHWMQYGGYLTEEQYRQATDIHG